MKTTVIDLRKKYRTIKNKEEENVLLWFDNPNHVYCGRANVYRKKVLNENGDVVYKPVPPRGTDCKWKNPFKVGKDGNLEAVLQKFRVYIRDNLELKNDIHQLQGKVLGCWCVGEHACHAQILAEMANRYTLQETASKKIRIVKELKESLDNELTKDNGASSDRCLDLLKLLHDSFVDINILSETLVGTIVSKFKSNKNQLVASTAKELIKKWKQIAKKSVHTINSKQKHSP